MLTVDHLYKSFHTGGVQYDVLKDVTFTIDESEFVAVMGPSGSGKTTLLNCISCFIPYEKGEIRLDDTLLANLDEEAMAEVRNKKLGFVFQDFMLLDGLTIFENVCVPKVITQAPYRPMEQKVTKLLQLFGIDSIANKYPVEISGGQKQRVAIARALATKPAIVLADEPTGNLDSKTSDEVMALLKTSAMKYEQTLIVITHNEDIAQMGNRKLVITDGKVVEQ